MNDATILQFDSSGEPIAGERDAAEVVGQALERGADVVVIPLERLDPAFFDLRTGVAGQIVNKFAVYRFPLVILGDVSPYEHTSPAFRDFVREANRGDQLWFVPTADDLATHLISSS